MIYIFLDDEFIIIFRSYLMILVNVRKIENRDDNKFRNYTKLKLSYTFL